MKIRTITRTITFTTVSVFAFDFEHREQGPHYFDYVVPGDLSKMNEDEQLSEIREALETKTFKVMTVEVKKVDKQKYAISELDFIRYGHIATAEDKDETEKEEG